MTNLGLSIKDLFGGDNCYKLSLLTTHSTALLSMSWESTVISHTHKTAATCQGLISSLISELITHLYFCHCDSLNTHTEHDISKTALQRRNCHWHISQVYNLTLDFMCCHDDLTINRILKPNMSYTWMCSTLYTYMPQKKRCFIWNSSQLGPCLC